MSRRKAQKKEISQAWLTTYSDTLTLILTFFVFLYSFALVDIRKFKAAANSINSAFGSKVAMFQLDENGGDAPIVGSVNPSNNSGTQNEAASNAKKLNDKINEFVNTNSLKDYVVVRQGSRGTYIEFKDKVLFDTGKSEIKDKGVSVLMKIAELIRNLPCDVEIEGHTDNVPIENSKFSSNWELSSARAINVLNFFTDNRGLQADRFSISAYGEYSPIASNDTPEGKALNRNVRILIVAANDTQEKSNMEG
ncbi:MAG: OmpA family protein [Clostridiales bacterium]|nr:OmpA family protein [Clostridiales bacterium]HBM81497.1 chemotaxis protein MotB [Clostridiaceae bacterium]